jgi:hypothetical protein
MSERPARYVLAVIEQRTSQYAALLLRLTLGSLFIAHLYWKFEILPQTYR